MIYLDAFLSWLELDVGPLIEDLPHFLPHVRVVSYLHGYNVCGSFYYILRGTELTGKLRETKLRSKKYN